MTGINTVAVAEVTPGATPVSVSLPTLGVMEVLPPLAPWKTTTTADGTTEAPPVSVNAVDIAEPEVGPTPMTARPSVPLPELVSDHRTDQIPPDGAVHAEPLSFVPMAIARPPAADGVGPETVTLAPAVVAPEPAVADPSTVNVIPLCVASPSDQVKDPALFPLVSVTVRELVLDALSR